MNDFDDALDLLDDDGDGVVEMCLVEKKKLKKTAAVIRAVAVLYFCFLVHHL